MKKNIYEKPSLVIVELQHKYQILAGSEPAGKGLTANPQSVVWDDDGLDDGDILR